MTRLVHREHSSGIGKVKPWPSDQNVRTVSELSHIYWQAIEVKVSL